MRIKATKGKQGIGTEVEDATYVEAAQRGHPDFSQDFRFIGVKNCQNVYCKTILAV
jgi:hypothetical protein